ncbi:HNH endonuclease [Companilactobacillus sp.]|uniref:HNH endonuclease n=1 Tax=Companilactobacillus sp. TaxID=2767905 RepID=UPI00260D9303|nr:HNH endonuclease [Companilactobacillus sp.]
MPEVNHLDCDIANNNAGNLEWCTHQENIAYKDKLGHTARNNAPKSPVYAINLATLKILHFNSQSEAGEKLMVNKGHINSVINGSRNQTGGFWFVNDNNNAADTIKQKLHEIKHRSTLKKYAI